MSGLPQGWTEATFGDVFDFKGGSQPPKSTFFSSIAPGLVRLLQIRDFEFDTKAVYIKDHPKWPKCNDDDIMVGRYGASVGKIMSGKSGAYNVALVKWQFDEHELQKRWVYHLLTSELFQGPLKNLSRSAQNGFNKEDISTFYLPLPPRNEQRRIAQKLDSLFARTKAARSELARIPLLIEHYKQAILEKAFTGELTADWRQDKARIDGEPWDLPETWSWGRFHDIAEVASNLVSPSEVLDLPHIAPNHLQSGIPRLLPYQIVREDKVRSAKHRFYPGQVIYSKIRPYLRKAVLVTFDGVCSADMYPLNAKGDPHFLLYWLLSPGFNDLALAHQGRVVLPKINQTALYSIPTPLPPLEEQTEIGKRISRAMAWLDAIGAEQLKTLDLLEELDAAVLSKAFRGQLVPQDANDEPAEKLLERIRAARSGNPNSRRSLTSRA